MKGNHWITTCALDGNTVVFLYFIQVDKFPEQVLYPNGKLCTEQIFTSLALYKKDHFRGINETVFRELGRTIRSTSGGTS